MKIKELTPAITAQYLADELNPILQQYVGKVCLFWDESTHEYGCIGGNFDGILGLIREIKAVPGEGHVYVELKTCNREFSCNIDNFYIQDDPAGRCIVDDISFQCDKDGTFQDQEFEPMFEVFDICEIQYLGFQEVISDCLGELITENFMGKYCIVEDESDLGESRMYDDPDENGVPYDPVELMEDLCFEPLNEESLVNLVFINGRGIPYQNLHITLCEQN